MFEKVQKGLGHDSDARPGGALSHVLHVEHTTDVVQRARKHLSLVVVAATGSCDGLAASRILLPRCAAMLVSRCLPRPRRMISSQLRQTSSHQGMMQYSMISSSLSTLLLAIETQSIAAAKISNQDQLSITCHSSQDNQPSRANAFAQLTFPSFLIGASTSTSHATMAVSLLHHWRPHHTVRRVRLRQSLGVASTRRPLSLLKPD